MNYYNIASDKDLLCEQVWHQQDSSSAYVGFSFQRTWQDRYLSAHVEIDMKIMQEFLEENKTRATVRTDRDKLK